MAQRVHVTLEDDIDGGKADETVRFGIDGIEYEIDLSKKNARALRDVMSHYVDAGRKVGNKRRATRPRAAGGRGDANQIRQWAAENGYEISERGRVPARVREAYEAATA